MKHREMMTLPCACAQLRRAARAATRMYNEELRASEIEITQYTLLMALDLAGEITQKRLGRLLSMDSTTLTRTLGLLLNRGWVRAEAGEDRREKLLSLTLAGRKKFAQARPGWERAQARLRAGLGERAWGQMETLLTGVASATRA